MKRLFAVVCVLGLLQSPTSAMAQASIAYDVGVKILVTLVGVLAGKGFDSVFAEDAPQPLTAEELGQALDKSLAKSFRSEYLKKVRDQISDLRTNVREYRSIASVNSRRNQIDAISGNADKIRTAIKNRIHDGQFFKLLPDFMMATNTWLAFQSERKFVTVNEDAPLAKRKASYEQSNHIVAHEVVLALGLLHEFYYHDFIDTSEAGKRDCIYKKPSQSLTNWQGENIPYFDSKFYIEKYGPKVCGLRICMDQFRHFCAGGNKECTGDYYKKKSYGLTMRPDTMGMCGRMKTVPIPAWSTNYRVFEKNKNEWVYIFKTKGKYTYYGPFKTKAEAEASRVARAMMSYRDILGDIPGMVRQWEKLVLAIGTDQNKSDAIRLVKELGVRR